MTEKLKTTTSVVIKCNIYKLSEYQGVCEIVEKRVKRIDLLKM